MNYLELSEEQFAELEKLAALNYSVKELAQYFGINVDQLQNEFNDPDSAIRQSYEAGQLRSKAKIQMALLTSAENGNAIAASQITKSIALNKLENAKKRVFLDVEKQRLDRIQKFMEQKHIGELDITDQVYFEQMDLVRSLHNKGHARSFILNVLISSYKEISFYEAKKIFSEAFDFFFLDNDIKRSVWANAYADQLDVVANIVLEMNLFDTYLEYKKTASKLRKVDQPDIDSTPSNSVKRVYIYTLVPEKIGLTSADRTKLGKYIDNLPEIPYEEKDRLHLEAQTGLSQGNIIGVNVEDVEYIEVKKNEDVDGSK